MKKNRISKNWLIKKNKDLYFKESKIYGYRSRSAFKLIEMNKKFKFLKKNISLLEKINNVHFINGNFCENEIKKKIIRYFDNKLDVVLSDMATNTSGNKSLDSFRTGELCIKAMNLAKEILLKDGIFLSKIFMGSIFVEIDKMAKKYFKSVIKYKPLSSKKESKEIYIYCKGLLKI